MTIGIGGSIEGVLAAAALRCLGGEMQARFWPVSRHQVELVRAAGLDDVEAPLTTADMARRRRPVLGHRGDRRAVPRGIDVRPDGVQTETLIMCSNCHAVRTIKTLHRTENGGPMVALAIR